MIKVRLQSNFYWNFKTKQLPHIAKWPFLLILTEQAVRLLMVAPMTADIVVLA